MRTYSLQLKPILSVGDSALSKLGGIPIDLDNSALPGRFLGYSSMFIAGGVFALASLIVLARVRE